MQTKHKALSGLKITDADQGKVEAVFATLNVKDSDGDVTLKGAFTDGAEVRISAYNHESWKGALPVGKGTIKEDGDEAILEGQFFLDTTAGKDTFAVVKEMGDLQEWSYGYDVVDSEKGTKDGESVQFLKELKVHEVSPVILGAGVDTRTLAVKGRDQKQLQSDLRRRLSEAGSEQYGTANTYVYVEDFDIDEGYVVFEIGSNGDWDYIQVSFTRDGDGVELGDDETEVERTTTYAPKGATNLQLTKHFDAVLAAVDGLADRVADVVAKRAEKGKSLGEESKDSLKQLDARMERLKEVLTPGVPADDESAKDLAELSAIRLRHE